jgi:glycolate oxidase FAD binding subunit
VHSTGGRVVKNVSGYDLGKLLVGALGTAGILLELHLRLRALPGLRTAAAVSFPTAGAAWSFLQAIRGANLEPAALVSLAGGGAGVPLRDPLPPVIDTRDGSRCVLCLLEGISERVQFQEKALEGLLRESAPEACVWLRQAEEIDALLNLLCALASPSTHPDPDLGIVRLVTLPSDVPRVEEEILNTLDSRTERELRIASDALTGAITVRWKSAGAPGAGTLSVDEPLIPLRKVAGGHAARGVLVYLPPDARRDHEYLLRPDPGEELARRFLQVLDPAGILSPGRLCGRQSGSPPEEEP